MPGPETAFCVAILGDFSGRGNRAVTETGNIASRRIYRFDRDNLGEVLTRLRVELHLAVLGKESPPLVFRFADLDDFHPDRVLEKAEVFDAFKEMRRSLKDPATLAELGSPGASRKSAETPAGPGEPRAASSLLDEIVEATQNHPVEDTPQRQSDLNDFVRQMAEPYSLPKAHQRELDLVANVDRAVGELMRKILHHPDFQSLEAAWRGVHFLVTRLETGENLKLHLIDISKDELAGDLAAANDITATAIYKCLCKDNAGVSDDEPWTLLAGNFTFDRTPEDAALLGRIAELAKAAGAPFIAAANPDLLGCESLAETPDPDDWRSAGRGSTEEAWAALRKTPEASFIGLALPRFLLRLPYGKETEPVESFEFEEMEGEPKHEEYLWGNPSFACVYLIAEAFSQAGWDFRPGMIQEIAGLPLHVYKQDGESRLKPCAEALLSQRAAEVILDHGLMPLLSFINQDSVRLARFQSIADPPSALLGRW
jgi:type VI secretion system protein ImpC